MQFFDESRMLLIAFALMGIATIALFFWFKQRISLIENKLETMFQLIQSHSEEPFEGTLDDPNFTMTESVQHNTEQSNDNNSNAYVNRNLMQVSDDDSEEVSDDDSEEVSDDESDNESDNDSDNQSDNQSDNKSDNQSDNEKKVEMEVENVTLNPSSLEELKNVEIDKKDLVELSFNVNNNDDNDSLDELDDDDDDNTIKKVSVEELTNYNILKVAELKNECKKKGLEGYSNLKKHELVELLNNSE